MPTPSIQTLRNDAQQVLNLDSISAVRSVVAATLANANAGTPLNPNLTTQQLWNEFYQIVTQPKSDIESIIANQLMKFLFAPPAPGGVGANGQVIFNDGGVLAGDAGLTYNKTTDTLTAGSATITGALTTQGTQVKLANQAAADCTVLIGPDSPSATRSGRIGFITSSTEKNWFIASNWNVPGGFEITQSTAAGGSTLSSNPTLRINNNSDFLFLDGAGGTRMTLNSTGLGVGTSPTSKLTIGTGSFSAAASGTTGMYTTASGLEMLSDSYFFGSRSGFGLMTLDSSGNVGIGVTPVNKLTIGTGTFNASTVSGSSSLYSTVAQGLVILADGLAVATRGGVNKLIANSAGDIISSVTGTAPSLTDNGYMVFNLTSNTNLRVSVRGTDGVTRTANLTLA